jgi:squalene cyclase
MMFPFQMKQLLLMSGSLIFLATPLFAQERTEQQKRVDRAIVNALRFLALEQQPSGAWRVDAYGESTASTSLAVMAFLAAGHVPDEGPYGKHISRGIQWVIEHQRGDGMLVHKTSHGPMYSHGISTLMLAEVVGMVGKKQSAQVVKALENAVSLILKAQEVPKARNHGGGWRYSPQSPDSDLSVTGWQLLALRAAKNVGCDVPKKNIDMAVAYVKQCSSGGGFTYQPGQRPTAVRTGTGMLALEVAGDHDDDARLRQCRRRAVRSSARCSMILPPLAASSPTRVCSTPPAIARCAIPARPIAS